MSCDGKSASFSQNTPKGLRLHIGLFGRRNVGKSSLLNAVTRQAVSIVSDTAGTTTDPVEKPMEMLPIGPVVFIDTAGIDDVGALGEKRIAKTRQAFARTDIAIIVTDAGQWGSFEEALVNDFHQRRTPVAVVFNKADIARPDATRTAGLQSRQIPFIEVAATEPEDCRHRFREMLIGCLPEDFLQKQTIVGDLVSPGDVVMLVVPIDLEAPKGRLILPQVQTIRDLLDHDACCMVVKERELRDAMGRLRQPPALVVTDSQAFLKVAADTPDDVRLTSFSILFARMKGDLHSFAQGARAIDTLRAGDRILVAEACTHHQIGDDIGRVKIPRWLTQYVGGKLHFDHIQGCEFPDDITPYKLVIHCGSCTFNRRNLLSRIEKCQAAGVPVTNYGIAIAKSLGIIERALGPFPAALEAYRRG
jgi:[FeFe] hydrogenase H-cluster maturation GTPase HydF